MSIAAASVLVFGSSSCGTTYVDTSPPADEDLLLGWSEVTPLSVTLPTDDPIGRSPGSAADIEHGLPTLVNVWASTCVPCREEMPMLQRIANGGELRVVGLSRDTVGSFAEDFLAETEVSFPNWLDSDASFAVALDGRIPLNLIPSTALLVDGEIRAVHIGEFDNEAEVLAGLKWAR